MGDYSNIEYFYVYVPFILQKVIDFSGKGYNNAKEHYGNGKLVERVVQYCEEQDFESVSPNVIVNYAIEIMEKGASLVLKYASCGGSRNWPQHILWHHVF